MKKNIPVYAFIVIYLMIFLIISNSSIILIKQAINFIDYGVYLPYSINIILSFILVKKSKYKLAWLILLFISITRVTSDLSWMLVHNKVLHNLVIDNPWMSIIVAITQNSAYISEPLLLCFIGVLCWQRSTFLINWNTLLILVLLNFLYLISSSIELFKIDNVFNINNIILAWTRLPKQSLFSMLIFFDCSCLIFLYAKNRGFIFYFYGLFFAGITIFLNQHVYDNHYFIHYEKFALWMDVTWLLAMLLNSYGLFVLANANSSELSSQKLLCSGMKLQEHLITRCFNASLIAIILIEFLLFNFSVMSLQGIRISYLLIMIYLAIMLPLLKNVMADIEQLFLKLKLNIEDTNKNVGMIAPDTQLYQFTIAEFSFINNFMLQAFILRQTQAQVLLDHQLKNAELELINQEEEKFKRISGQLIHDINSPLETVNSVLRLHKEISLDDRNLIITAITQLGFLIKDVLKQYNIIDKEDHEESK